MEDDLQVLQQEENVPEPETPEEDKQEVEAADNEELERIIKSLIKTAELEDNDLRFHLLRVCKRNDLYFNNIQTIFYDEVARDYRNIDQVLSQLDDALANNDIKVINIYKAYAESIIAALSVQEPNVKYMPDDADNPSDIQTADAYSKIEELIKKHNRAKLMLVKALTILYNCGVVFAYNYYHRDPSYGMDKGEPIIRQKQIETNSTRCAQCGEALAEPNMPCPSCGFAGPHEMIPQIQYVDEVVGYEETPKGRTKFDIFGPTHVKAPLYARNQAACGYLILRLEEHVARLKATYERNDIDPAAGDTTLYERWARIPVEYYGTIPKDLTTIRYAWFRPWFYWNLPEEDREVLLGKYPKGFMAAIVGETLLEHGEANLDEDWTISFDPKANFIHAEPAGNTAIPIQDSKNDVFNLGIQSIEYGIPETYVHPKTLNLETYKNQSATPGMLTQALPPAPDKSISDGFYTNKPATLSNEYTNFDAKLDQVGQFVTGALPSIWGGSSKNGDTTASEYQQSRSQALQRLQLTWEMISVFWSEMMFKCVNLYAQNLRTDERFVKEEAGTFINVWIYKTSLEGKVGHVEPELDGSLPQSWAQKKDFIVRLIELQNPEIGAILLHPNNSEFLKQSTGFTDIYIPGEHDRNKQIQEFYDLIKGEPVGDQPSVPVDIDVDDHPVHCQVLKNILVSPIGLELYKSNPLAYQNCIAHHRMHMMAIQAKTMGATPDTSVGQPPNSATNTTEG